MMIRKSGIVTNSEKLMRARQSAPVITPHAAKAVSQVRKEMLAEEIAQGGFREQGSGDNRIHADYEMTSNGNVTISSKPVRKTAQQSSPGSGSASPTSLGPSGYRGNGGTVRQIPEIYSPLWLTSNLNLPRDHATINAWCRAFFALNPIVQNAISLHSTYPISKMDIKCHNKEVEDFFVNMCEEIELENVCIQAGQEYWTLGEAFIYAQLDEVNKKWSRLIIQNPDYIQVKHSVIAGEPVISLRPDENLKRIITSPKQSDVQQRKFLDPNIVAYVKRGENIPLNNFYVSHLSRKLSPYDIRGTGLVTCCFRQLMLFDVIRECHDINTEVLTDQGFKTFDQVIEYREVMDGTYNQSYVVESYPKAGIKIACYNPKNEELEYHEPTSAHVSNYCGDMYHFHNDKVDLMVTPEHDLWASKKQYKVVNGKKHQAYWGEYKKIKAKDLRFTEYHKFQSQIKWTGKEIETVNVCGKEVPIELYLEFLGYLISEGCLYTNNKEQYTIGISQNLISDAYPKMLDGVVKLTEILGKKFSQRVRPATGNQHDHWSAVISGKDLYNHFKNEVGSESGDTHAKFKRIPKWILELSPRLLNILLDALVAGDGSVCPRSKASNLTGYHYYTISKQLADDVYELVYKTGQVPTIFTRDDSYRNSNKQLLYTLNWSDSNKGNQPYIYKTSKNSQTKEKHNTFDKVTYNDKVWCFEVPTGLFITRRNGKITIQGNSKFAQAYNMINPLTLVKIGSENYKPTPADLEYWRELFENASYDRDFKIFTHEGVSIERIGSNSAVIDVSADITQLIKEIYIGLIVPQVLMDGGGDVTYANGGVTLDVLRQRYMQFRNMLASWIRRKIFAPISKLNNFYERENGVKKLIVPEVSFSRMSLFDTDSYITAISQLAKGTPEEPKMVSSRTLFTSLGLDLEEENRNIREENIATIILKKETAALEAMNLDELRSLSPESEITEPTAEALPGEQLPGEEGGGEGGGGGLPGLDMGGGAPPAMPGGGESTPAPAPAPEAPPPAPGK